MHLNVHDNFETTTCWIYNVLASASPFGFWLPPCLTRFLIKKLRRPITKDKFTSRCDALFLCEDAILAMTIAIRVGPGVLEPGSEEAQGSSLAWTSRVGAFFPTSPAVLVEGVPA